MRLQTLISTMNLKDSNRLISEMNVSGDFVIVNQSKGAKYRETGNKKKVITIDEKGLSKSRNLALKKCVSEIALIADDDIEYVDGYEQTIKNGFIKYPDADVIAFYLDSEDEKNKKPRLKTGRIRGIRYFKVASWQLAIKVDSLRTNNIQFDEEFGAGSKYIMGEENILLSDIKHKGLKIYSYPVKIGNVCEKHKSTWFTRYDQKYFESRGAGYYRMSKRFYRLYIIQFALRKRRLFLKDSDFKSSIKYMLEGAAEYRKKLMVKHK